MGKCGKLWIKCMCRHVQWKNHLDLDTTRGISIEGALGCASHREWLDIVGIFSQLGCQKRAPHEPTGNLGQLPDPLAAMALLATSQSAPKV